MLRVRVTDLTLQAKERTIHGCKVESSDAARSGHVIFTTTPIGMVGNVA